MSVEIRDQINEILGAASPEARKIVEEMLKIEARYIHMTLPKGIHDDIVEMIGREVQ